MKLFRLGLVVVTSLLWSPIGAGCSEDGSDVGPGMDGGTPEECMPPESIPEGDPNGHAEPLGAGADEARAGRIGAEALPEDPEGLATWAAEDFVLANDRIAVLIEDAGESDLYDPYGGKIVGIAQVEEGALVAPADFNEVTTALGRFTLRTESVTVMNDGSDGEAAVVRALGVLSPVPFIEEVSRALLPGDYEGVETAIDYVLEPGAEHVDIRYTIRRVETRSLNIQTPIHFFMQSKRMPLYVPEAGFAFDMSSDPTPYLVFVDDDATSYGWASRDGDLSPLLEISGATVVTSPGFTVSGCSTLERDHARVYVGGPGLDGVLAARARTEGEPLRTLTGTVSDADGAAAPGVRVHATDGDTYLTRSLTDADGAYTLRVPEASSPSLTAYRRGDAVVGPVEVEAGVEGADLMLAPAGAIEVVATDAEDGPLPVRVQIIPSGTLPEVPDHYGEPETVEGRLHVAYPLDGQVTLRAPVGEHRVLVSRGFEYELRTMDVTVTEGETVSVPLTLERVVDTTGVICGDFHIHTHRSPDSEDDVELKLASAAADGLEIPVRSDHEWVADFEPHIADMGLEPWLFGIASLELTTFAWGHMGVFPLEPRPSLTNAGAISWVDRTPPAVFADVRSRENAPSIIINHPRSFGGFGSIGAYFDAAGYDPVTGTVDRPEFWDEDFVLVEVFNDSDFDDNIDDVVQDWFSFLSAGRPVFAVGSSDSHGISGSPVGYPRTCVEVGTDDVEALRTMGASHVQARMLEGRHTISGGIYLEASVGDVGVGGTVTGAGETELVDVTVRAASWVDVDSLRVFVDGALVETIPLDESTRDPVDQTVRFDDQVMVDVMSGGIGSWVVLVASGDMGLEPVHPGKDPFAVTNPIFLRR